MLAMKKKYVYCVNVVICCDELRENYYRVVCRLYEASPYEFVFQLFVLVCRHGSPQLVSAKMSLKTTVHHLPSTKQQSQHLADEH